MIDPRYPSLSRALSDSLLWRSLVSLAGMVSAAWIDSRTRRLTDGSAGLLTMRSIAMIGAIGGALALAAQFLVPSYVRSGLPMAWPLTAVVLLTVLAIWPAAFERAWPDSAFGRLSHQGSRGWSRRSPGEGG